MVIVLQLFAKALEIRSFLYAVLCMMDLIAIYFHQCNCYKACMFTSIEGSNHMKWNHVWRDHTWILQSNINNTGNHYYHQELHLLPTHHQNVQACQLWLIWMCASTVHQSHQYYKHIDCCSLSHSNRKQLWDPLVLLTFLDCKLITISDRRIKHLQTPFIL